MKRTLMRLSLVTVLNLALFELGERISVHWRESSQEMLLPLEWFVMAATLLWACILAFKGTHGAAFKGAALAILLFPVLYAVIAVYSWQVRPNLGFYQESDWVAENPGFQRKLRAQMQSSLWTWNRPKAEPATSPSTR